jgi:hypothetical protein
MKEGVGETSGQTAGSHFRKSSLQRKPVRQKKQSFLRSVRILRSAISPAIFAQVKSGPDVFADALVPCAAPLAPAQ